MDWFTDWFTAEDYEAARFILQRGVAAIFLIAFASTGAQFRALLGEHGLLPVPSLRIQPRAIRGPTLFRWWYSDRLLLAVVWAGVTISAALVVGLPQAGPEWLPLVAFLALWLLYMSIVNVGQTFYSFGWETLLLEAGFTVAFLGSDATAPPMPIILLVTWLVFRLEFGAGMIKMRGDRVWRDLTALYYHHETQPMPNPVSRFAPPPAEAVPPGRGARKPLRPTHRAVRAVRAAAGGEHRRGGGHPHPALADRHRQLRLAQRDHRRPRLFRRLRPGAALCAAVPADRLGPSAASPVWFVVLVLGASALLVILSFWPIRNLLSSQQLMNASFKPLASGQHLRRVRQRDSRPLRGDRGGDDERHADDDAEWLEYEFKGKPGDVKRMPRQFAPYHLRLDWLMWFLPLRGGPERWFLVFLMRLLNADRRLLRLLRVDPFAGRPPRWVRARLFHYRFSTRAERRATGAWWVREAAGEFVPPVSLPPGRGTAAPR